MAKIIDTTIPHFGRLKRDDGREITVERSSPDLKIDIPPPSADLLRELVAQRGMLLDAFALSTVPQPKKSPETPPAKVEVPAPVKLHQAAPKEWFITINRDIYGHIKSAEATNKENKTAFCFYVDTYADGVAKSIRVVKK